MPHYQPCTHAFVLFRLLKKIRVQINIKTKANIETVTIKLWRLQMEFEE